MSSDRGWIVVAGRGFPVRSDDDGFPVLHFDDEAAAQQWVAEHPKAKNAQPTPLVAS